MKSLELIDEIDLSELKESIDVTEDRDIRNWSCTSDLHAGVQVSCIDLLNSSGEIVGWVKRIWQDGSLASIKVTLID